nr:unnamed protein product [Callosobruchus chinensis]
MKPFLTERANMTTLSMFLSKYRSQETLDIQEPPRKKRGRCVTCGGSKNINITIVCNKCSNYVCKKHAKITHTCVSCDQQSVGSIAGLPGNPGFNLPGLACRLPVRVRFSFQISTQLVWLSTVI